MSRHWNSICLAIAALFCCSLTACSTLDSNTLDSNTMNAAGASAAASISDSASSPPFAPQPQFRPAQPPQQQLQTRLAPAVQGGSRVALASHNEPAGSHQAHQRPVANAYHQQTREQAGSWQVANAVHRADPRNPHGHVRQVDWHQCPTCSPALPSGQDCFSLEFGEHIAHRYRDEYICDGGDMNLAVQMNSRMEADGLDLEDTVAHFVTEDGKVVVEPSTRTCIYAPRFAAVRQIHSLAVNEHSTLTSATGYVDRPTLSQMNDVPTNLHQPVELAVQSGAAKLHENRDRNRATPEMGVTALLELNRDLLPFENLDFVRRGVMLNSEKARLANSIQNAITWTGDQDVQAVIDETPAVVAEAATGVDGFHEFKTPKGKPRLRVVKLADRDNAQPSDEVQFTLRFDNIGDQTIKQVVLLDNLSGRLEYIEGSSQSTIPAKFSSEMNDGESLTLRWELNEPLEVGKGGVIRFKCKVR